MSRRKRKDTTQAGFQPGDRVTVLDEDGRSIGVHEVVQVGPGGDGQDHVQVHWPELERGCTWVPMDRVRAADDAGDEDEPAETAGDEDHTDADAGSEQQAGE